MIAQKDWPRLVQLTRQQGEESQPRTHSVTLHCTVLTTQSTEGWSLTQ